MSSSMQSQQCAAIIVMQYYYKPLASYLISQYTQKGCIQYLAINIQHEGTCTQRLSV